MNDPLSPAEAKELLRLCETGRLYGVEEWIRAGKSIVVPKEVRKTPLAVAMSTGFRSLVELLLRHEQRQEAKDAVLEEALLFDRPAFVELALLHGADIRSVPFLSALLTGNRRSSAISAVPATGGLPVEVDPPSPALRFPLMAGPPGIDDEGQGPSQAQQPRQRQSLL